MLIKYKFECNGVEVTPSYTDALTKSVDKASGQQYFRTSLSGSVKFLGTDFDYIMSQPFDTEYVVTLFRSLDVGLTWSVYATGSFFRTDCSIDEDVKRITAQISATDIYTKIIAGVDTEYDIVKQAVKKKALTMYRRPMVQLYIPGASTVSCFANGATWEQDVQQETSDESAITNTYKFGLAANIRTMTVSAIGIPLTPFLSDEYAGKVGDRMTALYNDCELIDTTVPTYTIQTSSAHGKDLTDMGSIWLDENANPWILIDAANATSLRIAAYFHSNAPYNGGVSNRLDLLKYGTHTDDILYTSVTAAASFTVTYIADDTTTYMYSYNPQANTLEGTVNFNQSLAWAGTGTATGVRSKVPVYMRWLLDIETHPTSGATFAIPSPDLVEENRNYTRVSSQVYDNIAVSSRVTDTETQYGKSLNGKYFLPPDDSSVPWLPIALNYWGLHSFWCYFCIKLPTLETASVEYEIAGRQTFQLADAMLLSDVISKLLSNLDSNVTHAATSDYSALLYSNTSPLGAKANRLLITPKSNLITSIYNEPAKKVPIKLSDIFNMLRDCLDAYWFIDSSNRLRIEHISWFKNGGSYSVLPSIAYDLTALKNSKNGKPFAFSANEYSFDKLTMPQSYKFSWMDDVTSTFEGQPIKMRSNYVQQGKVEMVDVSMFTSDIDYIMLNPSDISKDGFALMAGVSAPRAVVATFTQGQYVEAGTGLVKSGTPYYAASGQISCVGASTVTINMPRNTTGSTAGIAFYTAASTFISGMGRPVGAIGSAPVTYTVPSNAAYYKTTYWNTANSALYGAFYGYGDFGDLKTDFELMYLSNNIAQVYAQNALLSFSYLHEWYKRHNLPCRKVTINGTDTTASGVIRNKVQKVSFPCADDISTNGLIKTYVGNGQIEKITVNLSSQLTSLELRYDTE